MTEALVLSHFQCLEVLLPNAEIAFGRPIAGTILGSNGSQLAG